MYQKELPISKATELPSSFFEALERWRTEADRILHSDEIKWFAKLASTTFTYNDVPYIVTSADVYSEQVLKDCLENILDAGFEILQKTITNDLINLGAKNIRNWGFLD